MTNHLNTMQAHSMATTKFLKVAVAIAGATLSLVSILANPTKAEEFRFTIQNNSDVAVSQVLVSEDGETWGYFNLDSNIAPDTEGEMVWGEHTNHEACSQWIKIGYVDGTITEPAKFDFCENPTLVVED
ncbi:hypothetical protein PN499_28120 [Kamptonema animale CS-326]|jgi:hypothetical protein|uniref:hypothetical protein n=1 Tax=Kamptonema animale TaxID=92934 RepID=UPI00232F1AB5|nr:hypothetical protein [Kamptonema animale]MDB9515074.1 hypothetical protein [Kamptonema animale CS-326]